VLLTCFLIGAGVAAMFGQITPFQQNPASLKHEKCHATNTFLVTLKTVLAGSCHSFGFARYAHR